MGRDPSCDLVLPDPKCSRRHAVLEAGPEGIIIRDTGSANGVWVNGKKVDRAQLRDGDVIRLGEVLLKVLPEDIPGTVIMTAPDEEAGAPVAPPNLPSEGVTLETPSVSALEDSPPLPSAQPASAAVSPPSAPRERPRRREALGGPIQEIPRPLTVSVLAALWAVVFLVGTGGCVYLARILRPNEPSSLAVVGAVAALALLSIPMTVGLWTLAPWARPLQVAAAGLGVLVCPFSLASLTVLTYMLRPAARAHFSGKRDRRILSPKEQEAITNTAAEAAFTVGILGTVLLGVVLSGFGVLLPRMMGERMDRARQAAREKEVIARIRAMGAAQTAFRTGTCEGYADLEGLLHPASVIPNYPASGPAFLSPDFARPEALGYRFALQLEEPVPPAEGCPSRSFRRYAYIATPVDGKGRHFLLRSDRVLRAAEGRPATIGDQPVR